LQEKRPPIVQAEDWIPVTSLAKPQLIPLWIKLAYTAFMAMLIPVYLKNYGPTNFLYFCDVAALMTLAAIWLESSLLLSTALVGAFVPQMLWVVDFVCEATGLHLTGMTSYMFDAGKPFFLRFLSFFHFWLVFLLIYLVWCVGYDKRGLPVWTGIAWLLLTVCYVWMPPASPSQFRDPNLPVNINYVYNIKSDEEPQQWMGADVYFAAYLAILVLGFYVPTHLLLRWAMPPPRAAG
jgi:hypothetical protein